MKRPKVYSYLRFSDPKQAAGGSADRQREYAQRWASENGLELDASLSLLDEGLSAYHQSHISRGALGVFLRAVEDGLVPIGSTLIVESLDRLSRAEPIVAQAQLSQIVNSGITVVTASDNREYNREKLKAQPMDLVYSLLVMIRAHEESATKSVRVKAAIRRQCEKWIAGSSREIVRNGHDPGWVQLVDGKFVEIPDRVATLKEVLKMYLDGAGGTAIVRHLSKTGNRISNEGKLHASHIYKLVRNRALVGEKTLRIDDEEYRLKNYYPAILTEQEFNELQYEANPRKGRTKSNAEVPSIISGFGIAFCGYCGGAITATVSLKRCRDKDGNVVKGHIRGYCQKQYSEAQCPVVGGFGMWVVEYAVLNWCSNQLNLDRLQKVRGHGFNEARLIKAKNEAAAIQQKIDRVTDAIADAGTSAALNKKLRALEEDLSRIRASIESLEAEKAGTKTPRTQANAEEWRAIAEKVLDLDSDARMKTRQLMLDTFKRIVVYSRGTRPPQDSFSGSVAKGAFKSRKGEIAVTLIAKTGKGTTLHISRTTGELISMESANGAALKAA